jgi:hypothetical protein
MLSAKVHDVQYISLDGFIVVADTKNVAFFLYSRWSHRSVSASGFSPKVLCYPSS